MGYIIELKPDVLEENRCHIWNQQLEVNYKQPLNLSQPKVYCLVFVMTFLLATGGGIMDQYRKKKKKQITWW